MITEYFKDCMTMEQLEKEHKRLVLQMHPDRNPDNPNATADFQEMQSQYEERKAELNGDYTASAKGRARREQAERERRERERNRLAEVINIARKNKTVSFTKYKTGDYIYARKLKFTRSMFDWDMLSFEEILKVIVKVGIEDETVVKIEHVFDMTDDVFQTRSFCYNLPVNEIYGGWEMVQPADPANGVLKSKKVAKVVMFRSPCFCMFGNPKGETTSISDYYVPIDYVTMFSEPLFVATAELEREQYERNCREAERKAKLLAEQQPIIDKWQDKLVAISAALNDKEKFAVAVDNMKKMFKAKFPGTTIRVVKENADGLYSIRWNDGPRYKDVYSIERLFDPILHSELTPWQKKFGSLKILGESRLMTTLTKASILQQLGEISEAFSTSDMYDEVTLSYFEWKMLHQMVGIDIETTNEELCKSAAFTNNTWSVKVRDVVSYVFEHTSYIKTKKTRKKKVA